MKRAFDRQDIARQLASLNVWLSAVSEPYYAMTNVLDHAVDLYEEVAAGKHYHKLRLAQYRGQKTLVMLYHGYLQGRAAFRRISHVLDSEIFDFFPVASNYQPYSQQIELTAERALYQLEWWLKHTDATRVMLVGHSQGGIVVRTMVQKLGGHPTIRRVTTLGTPNQGTKAAALGFANTPFMRILERKFVHRDTGRESGFQMLPGSSLIRELNSMPWPEKIIGTSIYSQVDPLVWPTRYCRLPYPKAVNVEMKKFGHMQVLYDMQAIELLLRSLLLPYKKLQHAGDFLAGYTLVSQEIDEHGVREWSAAEGV